MGAWVGPLISGLSAIGGGIANKQSSTGTQTPKYDPTNQAFRDFLISAFGEQLNPNNEANFGNAYKLGGVANLKGAADRSNSTLDTALAMRGLTKTGAGANAVGDTSYRAGTDIGNFLNQAVLDLANRHTQMLQAAGGYQSSLPVGTVNTGNMQGGGGWGGAIQGGVQGAATALGQYSAQDNLMKVLKALGYGGVNNGGYNVPG